MACCFIKDKRQSIMQVAPSRGTAAALRHQGASLHLRHGAGLQSQRFLDVLIGVETQRRVELFDDNLSMINMKMSRGQQRRQLATVPPV